MTVRIDLDLRENLKGLIGGENAFYCYQCGACVGDCPTARYFQEFNPREIVLMALYGLYDELLKEGSIIWKCTNCYNCYERCPQDVRPVEVVIALKNMASKRGTAPPSIREISEVIIRTGRSVAIIQTVNRTRGNLQLPPLPDVDPREIEEILKEG